VASGGDQAAICRHLGHPQERVMTPEQNKSIVRRFFDEVYNKGNLAVADELVAPDYVSHNQLEIEVLGPEGIKRAASLQRSAFPDQMSLIQDLIAEGDKVVVRGVDQATHQGPFLGYPPTGKRVTFTWIDIFRLRDGQLAEAWLEINMESVRRQLSG
jgi:steroid delta-isomerase-like uncharacterized protein